MAARFPQSGSSLNYRLKDEWQSKILAIFWPAGADSLHMLRPGDTATTLVNRSASGASFNSGEGRIEGTAAPFQVGVTGGLGLKENDNYSFGFSFYGDLFAYNDSTETVIIGSESSVYTGWSKMGAAARSYELGVRVQNQPWHPVTAPLNNDVQSLVAYAIRHNQADATAKLRVWIGENGVAGAETTGFRANPELPDSTADIGTVARPVYVGGTRVMSGNTRIDFESAWFAAAGLSDADMVALSTNPAIVLEEVVADTTAPTLTSPTATATGQTTASGSVTTDEGNGTLYYLASANSSESAATVKGGGSQAVTGTGVQNVSFTSLTAETSYYPHYVHVDAADNESNVASGSQFTTDSPPPPATKGVRIQLSAGAENLTGLSVRWWDDPTATGAPDYETDVEATDASGWLEIDLDAVTANEVDEPGALLVFKSGANPGDWLRAFGPVSVVDIGE